MVVEWIPFDVPDEIFAGLTSGTMSRFGSVVRDNSGIIAHLKEAALTPTDGGEVTADVARALRNPKVLAAIGAGLVATVGGVALWRRARGRRTESDTAETVERLRVTLTSYVEAAREGRLTADRVGDFILALDGVAELVARGKVDEVLPAIEAQQFAELVATHVRKLAVATGYDELKIEPPNEAADRSGSSVRELRHYLDVQREILALAA